MSDNILGIHSNCKAVAIKSESKIKENVFEYKIIK